MKQISLHILDIAENSVRAGASQIIVILEMDKTSDTLRLEITDNGSGMEKETIDRITDPFFTTRTTRKVGLGCRVYNILQKLQAVVCCLKVFREREPG